MNFQARAWSNSCHNFRQGQLKVDVAQLREDVGSMKEDVTGIKKWIESADRIYATKEDLHKQTWRLYGAMASLTAAVFFIARYVH
ncbi:hypothetical protein ASD07_05250 [Duganella sp. Root336D2]|nr:hypothetical protein ASD07_05250 [Duganella sp. Root336D2]